MTLTATIPAIVLLLGIVLALQSRSEVWRLLGFIMFACGLFIVTWTLAGHPIETLNLLPKK